MGRHLVPPLSTILLNYVLSVDWQTFVGIDRHTKQSWVGLQEIEETISHFYRFLFGYLNLLVRTLTPVVHCKDPNLKVRSHRAIATEIFHITANGLYRIQCKCLYRAIATTLPTRTQPIRGKNNSQSQIAHCEWALRAPNHKMLIIMVFRYYFWHSQVFSIRVHKWNLAYTPSCENWSEGLKFKDKGHHWRIQGGAGTRV